MGASSVLFGAFGAHGLKNRVSDASRLQNWSTASHYQMLHSVMILISARSTGSNSNRAAFLFSLGNLLFSGSIYALTLLPKGSALGKVLGPVTPIGGLCYVAGWLSLLSGR